MESIKEIIGVIFSAILVIILFLAYLYIADTAEASPVVNMDYIAQIESSGGVNNVSYRGAKYGRGMYQVSEICLQEYNERKGTNIAPEELFNDDVCYRVAMWYMNVRIPIMLRYFNLPVSSEMMLIAYNSGISYCIEYKKNNYNKITLPVQTRDYIVKYYKLERGERL